MNDPTHSETKLASDPQDEELVAYLDGELDDAETRRVETRLATDSDYRSRLQRLQQAWDMLDCLPRAQLDQTFTRSTVEMVAVSAQAEMHPARDTWRLRSVLIPAAAAALLVVAGMTGYLTTRRWLTADDRQLVRDLPVIENMDLYYPIDDIEFLRQLEQEGIFEDGEGEENAI